MARILMTPEETSYVWSDKTAMDDLGWAFSTDDSRYWNDDPGRPDVEGNGGARSIIIGRGCRSNVITLTSPALGNIDHGFASFGWQKDANSSTYFQGRTAGAMTFQIDIAMDAGSPLVLSNAGGVVATGTATPTNDAWFSCEVEWVFDGAGAATIKVYVDGTVDISYTAGSGYLPAQTVTHLLWKGQCNVLVDDLAANSITLKYDGGSGSTPTLGNTLTDGGTASTAKITSYTGDATAGVLTIRSPSGAFGNNNAIVDGSGFVAVVDAPDASYVDGLEPNSARLGNQFQVAVVPTGAGSTTQLTPSTGANWENVDEVPPNSSDYNTASTADHIDTYANNAASQLTVLASVQAVASVAHCSSSVTGIDGLRHVLADGTTVATPSDRVTLASGSFSSDIHIWNVRPDTNAGWDRTAIVTTLDENGVKFVT
jgi:hypothetical protein